MSYANERNTYQSVNGRNTYQSVAILVAAPVPAADNLVPHPRNDEWRHAFRQMADAKIARLEAIMAEAGGRYYDATMERLLDWRARLA